MIPSCGLTGLQASSCIINGTSFAVAAVACTSVSYVVLFLVITVNFTAKSKLNCRPESPLAPFTSRRHPFLYLPNGSVQGLQQMVLPSWFLQSSAPNT